MQGTLRLSCPGLPDLGCLLTELRPDGCRATIMFQFLPNEIAAQWRNSLQLRKPVRARIESNPEVGTLEVNVIATRVVDAAQYCEIELSFHQLTPGQAALLRQVAPPAAAPAAQPAPPATPPASSPWQAGNRGGVPPPPPPDNLPPSPPPVPAAPAATNGGTSLLHKRIGALLVHMGKLNSQQIEQAAGQARASGERLGQFLVRTGRLSPNALCRALALQSGLPMTDLSGAEVSDKLAKSFSYELMTRYGFVPFDDAGTFVCIAAASPLPADAIKQIEQACHRKVELFLAREDQVRQYLHTIRSLHQVMPRKYLRYDVSLPVTYQFCTRLGALADQTLYRGLALNISEGGFSVDGPAPNLGTPEDLQRVGMCVSLVVAPGTAQQLKCLCRPKLIQPNGPRWLLGLEIVEASTDDRRRLKELCVQAMLAQAKRAQGKPPDTG